MSRLKVIAEAARTAASVPRSIVRDLLWNRADKQDRQVVSSEPLVLTEAQKAHWSEHGWVILEKSVTDDAIARLNREVDSFRRSVSTGQDEFGHGLRIGLLHAENRWCRRVSLNPQVLTFLRWALDGEPTLFGSLTFDIGSEQEPHIDAAFFYTQPETAMAAAWTALEDIDPDSGPLFYVDASHRMPRLYASEVLAGNPDLARRVIAHRAKTSRPDYELSEEVYRAYSQRLQERIEEHGLKPTPAVLRKGDVFVWNGWLIHGGLPRRDRRLTRRSLVVHYIRPDARFYDQHAFFLRGDVLDTTKPVRFDFRRSPYGDYVKYHRAVTFDGSDGHFKA